MLGEDLRAAIRAAVEKDPEILKLAAEYETGSANYLTARKIAKLIGARAADILSGSAVAVAAERDAYPAIMDALREVWEDSAGYAARAQEQINQSQGLQVRGLAARANMANASGIANAGAHAASLEEYYLSVVEPVKLFSEMAVNETIDANADFLQASGVRQIMTRNTNGKCCDWCDALEGSWEYGKQPADFFKQHERCRCIITARSEKVSYRVNGVWNRGKGKSQKYTMLPKRPLV